MSGESNLAVLLSSAKPEHNPGDYVFCSVNDLTNIDIDKVCVMVREKEAVTLVLRKETADAWSLPYTCVFGWITLTIHSSLEAVGLTAAFSAALARENISCNVVAGFYHDHIFVGVDDLERALGILSNLPLV